MEMYGTFLKVIYHIRSFDPFSGTLIHSKSLISPIGAEIPNIF